MKSQFIHVTAETDFPRNMKSYLVKWASVLLVIHWGSYAIAQTSSSSSGQPWPTKPLKIVVNFPPGGAADQIARAISVPLQDALGQPVRVENKGGSGGNLGGDAVAKSPADGYTLLMSSGGMVSVNPHICPKMPFDPAQGPGAGGGCGAGACLSGGAPREPAERFCRLPR